MEECIFCFYGLSKILIIGSTYTWEFQSYDTMKSLLGLTLNLDTN